MAIGMVELQGTIQRTQDFTAIKHQENTKVSTDQSNYQTQTDRRVEEKHSQVVSGDDAAKTDTHADAKEQGKNTYGGDGGANRKPQKKTADGTVILKGNSHFDMSV